MKLQTPEGRAFCQDDEEKKRKLLTKYGGDIIVLVGIENMIQECLRDDRNEKKICIDCRNRSDCGAWIQNGLPVLKNLSTAEVYTEGTAAGAPAGGNSTEAAPGGALHGLDSRKLSDYSGTYASVAIDYHEPGQLPFPLPFEGASMTISGNTVDFQEKQYTFDENGDVYDVQQHKIITWRCVSDSRIELYMSDNKKGIVVINLVITSGNGAWTYSFY